MTKRIDRFQDWISASESATLLTKKLGRNISPEYITKLAKSKKQPIRTQQVSNQLFYNRDDILASNIKMKAKRRDTTN